MLINSETIAATRVGFRTDFANGLKMAQTLYKQLAMEVPSTKSSEEYKWFLTLPVMKEFLGDRELAKLVAMGWAIKNKKWANGVEVDVDDLEDDNLGLIRPQIQQLGLMAEKHKDSLLFLLLKNGFTGLCYDGKPFFATDHQDGSETPQSNKGTAALAAASYEAAWSDFGKFTDAAGEPIEVDPTHLVVGPSNRSTARSILIADRNANGASNTNKGTTQLIVSPRLVGTAANYWSLLALDQPVKPFVYQNRKPVQFAAQDSLEDENGFMRDVFRYGAKARYNMGYALWQMAWASDGTL